MKKFKLDDEARRKLARASAVALSVDRRESASSCCQRGGVKLWASGLAPHKTWDP